MLELPYYDVLNYEPIQSIARHFVGELVSGPLVMRAYALGLIPTNFFYIGIKAGSQRSITGRHCEGYYQNAHVHSSH